MSVKIIKNNELLKNFVEKGPFQDSMRDKILNSDIVLLPQKGFREEKNYLFPSETPRFYKYLKEKIKDKEIVIATEKENPDLLQLNDFTVKLPIVNVTVNLIENVGIPFLISLIAGYIPSIFPRESKKNEIKIIFEMRIDKTKTKKSLNLHYEGDYNNFEKSFGKIDINKLLDEDE